MNNSNGIFKILYPPKNDMNVTVPALHVFGVSVYSNRDLIALLRDPDNAPERMWMGRGPEREPPGDFWYFLFDTVPEGVECNLEIWCGKCQELLGRVRGLTTVLAAAQAQAPAAAGAIPKLNGPNIGYPIAPGDNPLPSPFLARGGTDDFTDPVTAVMSKGSDSVTGVVSGIPSQYQPNWNATFDMGSRCGTGWTLTVTQGTLPPVTSTGLTVVRPC